MCVPPVVGAALVTVTLACARSEGSFVIFFAATLPLTPLFTAVMGASALPGVSWNSAETVAAGTETVRVVTKAMPPVEVTCVPATIGTVKRVLMLVNVTVPVAAASSTFSPVAWNVPSADTGNDFLVPGTVAVWSFAAVTDGSTLTLNVTGPSDSSRSVSATVAPGRKKNMPPARTTARSARTPATAGLETRRSPEWPPAADAGDPPADGLAERPAPVREPGATVSASSSSVSERSAELGSWPAAARADSARSYSPTVA